MKVTEFYQIVEEIKLLNDRLVPLGFELSLQAVGQNRQFDKHRSSNAVPQIQKVAVKGIGKYWAAINEIATKKSITKAEAKEIYKNKAAGKTNEKVASGMTKYWNTVRSVVAEKNISVSEARAIVGRSLLQLAESVV